jgi:hypothetical protein
MEFQLVQGYDDTGFITSQPWKHDFPPKHLTFGTWDEFGKEVHVNFFTFDSGTPADPKTSAVDALSYAVDVFRNPTTHTSAPYATGAAAYDQWIKAVPEHGASHGNWWNGVVWGECRQNASAWFDQLTATFDFAKAECADLAGIYSQIGAGLNRVSNKDMDADTKVKVLGELREQELAAIDKVEKFVATLKG